MTTWQEFVIAYGWKAREDHLAFLTGVTPHEIRRFRGRSNCLRRKNALRFNELFTYRYGRAPHVDEWPTPRRYSESTGYEWLGPELALLASLVGQIGTVEIAQSLTDRLRKLTADPTAERTPLSCIVAANRMGMTTLDVVGGKTVSQAARELGTRSILDHYIRTGRLRIRKVGRLHVIPYAELERFKASRVYPPKGFIRLATLRKRLGIRSDKLSEWARQGYIETAIRCNPTGTRERCTQFGTWYVDSKVARKILDDRHAGRPMPWHGKLNVDNAKKTYKLWRKRQHPAECRECEAIWGVDGPPQSFGEYCRRYPSIAFGAKRHMTLPFKQGLSMQDCADKCGVSLHTVKKAIASGMLRARQFRGATRVSMSDASLWKGRRCPEGDSRVSWLSIPTACKHYGFTPRDLERHIKERVLKVRIGTDGPQRGVRLVAKQQMRELRDALGFSEAEAARRIGVSVARLQVLLRQLEWRGATPGIPLEVVNNARVREESAHGLTIPAAARAVGKPVSWVHARITDGTIRPLRTRWNKQRRYVSAPMLKRLRHAVARPPAPRPRFSKEWLLVSDAADLGGVSVGTIQRYAELNVIRRRHAPKGFAYHKRSVEAWARRHWAHSRFRRQDRKPVWLLGEQNGAAA